MSSDLKHRAWMTAVQPTKISGGNGNREKILWLRSETRGVRFEVRLLLFSAVFGDVHDLVLEDEKIGRAFAGEADHVLIVVLDPSADDLAVHQLDRDSLLLFAERFEE